MSKKLYVGNLPFSTNTDALRALFEQYGPLGEVLVIAFKDTGKSKGFGFVTLESDEQAAKAIQEMNGKEVEGRKIFVNEAQPFDANRSRNRFSDRPRFGGRGGGFGGERRGFGGGGGGGFGRREREGGAGGGFGRSNRNEEE